MVDEKGTLSIHTENIFPIIKKFLYSDQEIFLRELVSNAVDASQKLKRLAAKGEYQGEIGDLKIQIAVNKEAKTITVSDNGIGMTAEEVKKYINQIAFSGASEFLEKLEENGKNQDIIGHFGLGFYSAFMVSDTVDIITKSYQEGAEAVKWSCDGSTEFSITNTVKKAIGTDVILHLNEEASNEFLESERIKTILEKYCKFMPIPIEFEGQTINNPEPIWTKSPSELKDEDYINFYKELYPYSVEEPLFWIHLNVDYPFNLTGVLYFPKIKNDLDVNRNKIQLYCRQVFITEEVKDIVPDFLMLLHGVIDSPDIPLNVSRSYLQSDSSVKKINAHITKKVADKLSEIFKKDRKGFEEKFENIELFIKYGMITEEKFYERAKDFVLLKNTEEQFFTIDEYKEKVKINQTDKDGNIVFLYATDSGKQDAYIQSANNKSYDVLKLEGQLDSHFINTLEQKLENVNMKRVDAETVDKLIDKDAKQESALTEEESKQIQEIFQKAINDDSMTVTVESMAPEELPVTITMPEFMRRMKDMAATGGGMQMMGQMPDQYNVAVNGNHELIRKILNAKKQDKKEKLAKQAYDLGLLSQNMLSGKNLTDFIKRSSEMLTG